MVENLAHTLYEFTGLGQKGVIEYQAGGCGRMCGRMHTFIEAYLADRRKSEYMKLLVGKPFSIGVVLSYFFLCKGEDSLVSAVLSAKNYKWSETKIREALGL